MAGLLPKDVNNRTLDEMDLELLGRLFGRECAELHLRKSLCFAQTANPLTCAKENKDVVDCGLNVARTVKKSCSVEYRAYSDCFQGKGHKYVKCLSQFDALSDCFLSHHLGVPIKK